MVISKKYALKLIREKKATPVGYTTDDKGNRMIILARHDLMRTDHYYDDPCMK